MGHPTDGVLRRLLDEPAGVPDAERAHVAGCDACRRRLEEVRADAEAAVAALVAAGSAAVDVDVAHRRLVQGLADPSPVLTAVRGPGRRRSRFARPAVAGVAVAVVLAGAGAAAANGWIPILRTERVTPISISADDLTALPDLQAYGVVHEIGDPADHEVADAEAAAAATGLEVPVVDELPDGVSGEPAYRVVTPAGVDFTFSTARAERAARAAGGRMPAPPPGLDGSRVRLRAGPGLAVVWTQRSGLPALVVARAFAPVAESDVGVPFDQLRDHLLAMPGIPDRLADSLRAIDADGTTLPFPVPEGWVDTSSADVDGHPATVLALRGEVASAVVWVSDGVLHLVGGSLTVDEVLSVARGLR